MANFLYPVFKRKLMEGTVNLTTDTLRMGLFTASALPTAASSAVDIATIVNNSTINLKDAILTGKMIEGTTSAVFDCSDPTFSTVSGGEVTCVIVWKEDGVVKLPIAYIDSGSGLPFTPTGGNVIINISNSATKLFAL